MMAGKNSDLLPISAQIKPQCQLLSRPRGIGLFLPDTFGPSRALEQEIDRRIQRRNKMLGLGLVGTIIVIVLLVWIVRRV
jgi:hypothetical protein